MSPAVSKVVATAMGRPIPVEVTLVFLYVLAFIDRDMITMLLMQPVMSCIMWDERGVVIIK